jgi:fructooligosaccharide transport system substrate-binding protein
MKANHLFRLLSVLVVASVLLTACAAPSTSAPATSAVATVAPAEAKPTVAVATVSGEVVELTMFQQQDVLLVPAMRAILDDFEKANPNIKVTLDSAPFAEYHTKLSTSFAGGNPPDVFWMDIRTATYASQGVLMPLDDRITQENRDDVLPAAWKEVIYNGVTYGVPLHELTEGLFINTQMAEEAGVKIPTNVDEAWTWEQFMVNAKKMTKVEGGQTLVWGFGQQRPLQDWSILPLFLQHGTESLSPDLKKASGYLNSAAGVEAMTFMSSWFNTEKIMSTQNIPDGFPTGKIAIFQAPSSYRPLLESKFKDFKFTIAPLFKDKNCAVTTGGWAMAIAAGTKHPEEAWKLVDYVTRTAHEKWVMTSGYLPVRKSVIAANPQFAQYPWKVFMEQLEKCSINRPATPDYTFYSDTFNHAVVDISVGLDPKTVLDAAAQKLDVELSK